MKQFLISVSVCSVMMLSGTGTATAQDEGSEGPSIFPVEVYTCNYNEGKGPADLDSWSEKWNAWADSGALEPYSAWTLTPFYFGSDQDFDFIWLGAADNAVALGRAYDKYLNDSGDLQAQFNQFASCGGHSNFATYTVKEPPDNDDSTSFVLSFSDCTIAEGKTFDDVAPALQAWSEYRTGHGSEAGMWVLFPAYGGGDADYDFKFVASHADYATLGTDYDQYGKGGYAKAEELFNGLLECNEARVYNASARREGMSEDS